MSGIYDTPFGVHARTILSANGTPLREGRQAAGSKFVIPSHIAIDWHVRYEHLEATQSGKTPVEVRIGVGPLLGPLPVRVLAYASYVVEALGIVREVFRCVPSVHIFSSSPKTSVKPDLRAAVILEKALGLLGSRCSTSVSLSSPQREVLLDDVQFPSEIEGWIDGREEKYAPTRRHDLNYAVEHAAQSMFGDISTDNVFRVTVGGANEGRFWAVRQAVRVRAAEAGLPVVPAMAMIFPAFKVPWYSPTPEEPGLFEVRDDYVEALERAANPKYGGNPGLAREAKLLRALSKSADVRQFAIACRRAWE